MEEAQETPQVPSDSVFHPDNVGPVTVIQLSRIYDAVMGLLSVVDPERAVQLAAKHEVGAVMMPAPAFAEEDVLESDS